MKKLLILLFFILIFGSCTTNYFLCETAGPVKLYASPNTNSTYIEVPVGKNLISTGKYKKYRRAKYGNKRGYVYKTRFLSEKKIQSAKPPVHLFKTKRFYFEVLFQNEASLLEQNQTAFKWTSNPI